MAHCQIPAKFDEYSNQGEVFFQTLTGSSAVSDRLSRGHQEPDFMREASLLHTDGVPATLVTKRNLVATER